MKREPRLKFTQEEMDAPELEKPIRKVKKAAAKADKAQAKIPKKQIKQRSVDPATGKVTTKLSFEDKKPPSKLSHAAKAAPVNTASTAAHREIRQYEYEDENVGLEAAHFVEGNAESGARLTTSAVRSQRLRPYRKAAAAESKLEKANLNALYKKAELEQPTSNPVSKWQQRRAIRKQYAAAKAGRSAETTKQAAEATGKAAEAVRETAKKTADFVRQHKKSFLIVGAVGLALAFMLNVFSSCTVMLEGAGSAIAASTYPSEDADMLAAEAAYCGLENELQSYLDSYESTHEYDEYHYDLDSIEHDPYVLISILTALRGGAWTIDQVQGELQMLFDKQYILTEDVTTETRYRTETRTGTRTVTDPETGDTSEEEYEYDVQVPYTYYICNVKLENFNLSHVPVYIMGEDQLSMYATYMATLGNRDDLFPASSYVNLYNGEITRYEIPPEALSDEKFAAMIAEAEKYLGYPYVWGGSSPSTSFDCSGFVSWVINHCGQGWDFGRLGSDGLYFNVCTPIPASEARPGDLIFFQGTYDTPNTSHVGIYVGDGMMIHCGNPIQYASINTSYWQQHFYGFGRLP